MHAGISTAPTICIWQFLEDDRLTGAIKALQPTHPDGPWHVICDNEAFLRTPACQEAHKGAKVKLWKIPPRSPDLNPSKKYWAWLRKHLRELEFDDLRAQKPSLTKAAFRERVRRVCSTQKSKTVAANCAKGLRKVCQKIVDKRGAASGT